MPVNLKDVARAVGLSVTTVSRALNGYDDVAEETRQRIADAAVLLGYSPNLNARRLKKKRTDTLGFVMPTFGPRFSDPFFSELIAGIGNQAAAHEYDLLVSTHAPDSEGELKVYTRAADGGWVDGMIVVRTREDDRRIRLLQQAEFPFVAFGRTTGTLDFPYVDEDGAAGMSLLTQHFINLGHKRIGFIAAPFGLMFGRYRLQGFQDTLAANGIKSRPEQIVIGDMTQSSGAEAVKQLRRQYPDFSAIIACNDLMAIGTINQLQRYGIQVGENIAVGGFDDIPTAAYATVPLTTVHQPIYDIGRRASALLIDIINNNKADPAHILLKPTLVVRESSCPAV